MDPKEAPLRHILEVHLERLRLRALTGLNVAQARPRQVVECLAGLQHPLEDLMDRLNANLCPPEGSLVRL